MRKTLISLGLVVLALSITSLAAPASLFGIATLDTPFAVAGIVAVLSAMVFTSGPFANIDFRPVFGAAAVAAFILLVVSFASPTLWGERSTYIPVMDLFVTLESAVVLGLAALEHKVRATSLVALVLVVGQLLANKFRTSHALRSPYNYF